MLHFLDRFLAPLLRQILVAPVVEQPVVKPILIDRRQFVPKRFVEKLDDFRVTLHNSLLSGARSRRQPPCPDSSKKRCRALPVPAAHLTTMGIVMRLDRVRGVQRAGAADRTADLRT